MCACLSISSKGTKHRKAITVKLVLYKQRQVGITARAWSRSVSQTEDFHSFEIRTHFKKDTTPAKVQVIVEFESSGILEIRNIELLKAPVKLQS